MEKKLDKLIALLEHQITSQQDCDCGCGKPTCDSQVVHSSAMARYNDGASANALEAQRMFQMQIYNRSPST